MTFLLRQPWWLGILALGLWQGCGEPRPPVTYGPNLVINSSFESGLDGWWATEDPKVGKASTSPDAADLGAAGLVLYKGTEGWGSTVGQGTQGHVAMQTFQVQARLRGVEGGERVAFSFHGEGFEVVAERDWRTVSRMVLMPELNGNASAQISVTTNEATVHVDDVSFTWVEVERGDADQDEDNLVRNGSFESDLGLWGFWTDSPEGAAYTTPEERHSGYAGMVLTRGPEGSIASVKQSLLKPVFAREEYRIEARIRGASGGEQVNLCLQLNLEPWSGPCLHVKATQDWQRLSEDLPIDEALDDKRVGALVSLGSEGTVFVDDVIVVRKKR